MTIVGVADSSGVDTIAVTVPLAPGVDHFQNLTLAGGVQVRNRGGAARVEVCLPKRLYGHNLLLLNQQETINGLHVVLDELANILPIQVESIEELQVSRIDIAHNARVEADLSRYLYAVWGSRYSPNGRPLRLLMPGPHGHATQLILRTNAWSISLYDKGLESGHLDAQGVMRVEVRLQRRFLMDPPDWARFPTLLLTVGDFTDEQLADIHENTVIWNHLQETFRDIWDGETLFGIDWDKNALCYQLRSESECPPLSQ